MKLLKNKKVILALVTLVATLVAVSLNVELGDSVSATVTEIICQAVTCV